MAGASDRELDFYRRLRARVDRWLAGRGAGQRAAEVVAFAPDFFYLMVQLVRDPEVASEDKWKLAAAIAYFVSPFDLLPEALLGPVGFLDDVGLAAFVLNGLLNRTVAERVRAHWPGRRDVLEAVQQALALTDELLGSGLWGRLKRVVEREPR